MSFTIKKENKQLIFNDLGGYETRNPSTFWCIQEADKIYNWNDFTEVTIHTTDYEDHENQFTYSKKNNVKNTIPDFNFHSWPQVGINDYDLCVKEIDHAGLSSYEVNKVGWIGNINTNYMRKHLYEIGRSNPELFDITEMSWVYSGTTLLHGTKYISIPELVKKYSILIDIGGAGYSGRLKYLFWSHRPVLLVDRVHKEYFFEFLQEWVHYIPVKRNLLDLVEKTKWCLDNYDKALKISENAYEFSKVYLTRDACYKQWNKIISTL